MINLMLSRRSIRKFTAEPVSDEHRNLILTAGLLAPSSMNKKPVELIAVTDRAVIETLPPCKSKGNTALLAAPFVVAVIADGDLSDVWAEDASIAATYIFLQAEKLGLGCTWVQIHRRQGDTGPSEDMVRAALDIPAHMRVLALMCIGHPEQTKPAYTEADVRVDKIHYNKF